MTATVSRIHPHLTVEVKPDEPSIPRPEWATNAYEWDGWYEGERFRTVTREIIPGVELQARQILARDGHVEVRDHGVWTDASADLYASGCLDAAAATKMAAALTDAVIFLRRIGQCTGSWRLRPHGCPVMGALSDLRLLCQDGQEPNAVTPCVAPDRGF
jgi:hypothetical protein